MKTFSQNRKFILYTFLQLSTFLIVACLFTLRIPQHVVMSFFLRQLNFIVFFLLKSLFLNCFKF